MRIADRCGRSIVVALCLITVGVKAVPATERIDQSNLPEWAGGWTNVNPAGGGQAAMWQTFTPGCPNLTAVEIDILTISPGRGDDVLTVEIAKEGVVLASTERSVKDGFDGLLRFDFPEAVSLIPEQIYELKVRDTGKTLFGWKYGSNTYERGSRYVFAQQRPGTDWFFRNYARVEPTAAKYGGGTGEPNDPYRIATAEHLNRLAGEPNDWDKHFRLVADIDLSGFVYDAAPIAPDQDPCDPAFQGRSFTGTFDGDGRTIGGLTIRGGSYLGLFGQLEAGAEVKNLRVVDANIIGADCLGALAGFSRGSITRSCSAGSVRGEQRVGGLVGRNWGTVAASFCAAAVTAQEDAGGLAAHNYGSVANSYSTGAVTANRDAGGLVGENYGHIVASYSTGTVGGTTGVGGLVGYNWVDADVSASFWDRETSGQVTSAGGTAKTAAEMQAAGTFLAAGWDFVGETANGAEDIWWIDEGGDYPRLWWELPEPGAKPLAEN